MAGINRALWGGLRMQATVVAVVVVVVVGRLLLLLPAWCGQTGVCLGDIHHVIESFCTTPGQHPSLSETHIANGYQLLPQLR